MYTPVFVVAAVAFVFYICIPVLGAFRVRALWRGARLAFEYLATRQRLSFADVAQAELRRHESGAASEPVGTRAVFGTVQAVEGGDRLWVAAAGQSALVDMAKATLYVLEGRGVSGDDLLGELAAADARLAETSWRSLPSIDSGTRVFAGGRVFAEGGAAVMKAGKADRPFVVFYDGDDRDLLPRVIWSARSRNEYWNALTFTSLAIGISAAVVALSATLLRPSFSVTVLMAACLASLPLMPLVPPGVPLFFAYRNLWRRSRILRAKRDVVKVLTRTVTKRGASRGDPAERLGERLERAVEAPPEGIRRLDPGLPGLDGWTLIEPGSAEPWRTPVCVRGSDPARLARACDRAAAVDIALSIGAFVVAVLSSSSLVFFGFRFFVK